MSPKIKWEITENRTFPKKFRFFIGNSGKAHKINQRIMQKITSIIDENAYICIVFRDIKTELVDRMDIEISTLAHLTIKRE